MVWKILFYQKWAISFPKWAFLKSGTVIAYEHPAMETIAITNWNNIISPLYDVSCCLLIVRSDGEHFTIDISNLSIIEKASACKEAGAAVLICGAISNIARDALIEMGIKVVAWIRGPVADVICAYRNDEDIVSLYAMPGCGPRMCGRCFRRRRFAMRQRGK